MYSAEDPPERRGLVLVDALSGSVLERWVEDNPETWIETVPSSAPEAPDAAGVHTSAIPEPGDGS